MMHFQSYMNKMTVSLTVDPTIISDTHRLLDDGNFSKSSVVFQSLTQIRKKSAYVKTFKREKFQK